MGDDDVGYIVSDLLGGSLRFLTLSGKFLGLNL